jgi:cell division septum initiation protein DivIVA
MNQHTLVFDKLIYLDRLKSAGVSEEIARAHADGLDQALRESVATRTDLEAVERSLKADIGSLKAEIETVERKLDAKIDTSFSRLETKIAEAQTAATRWMIATAIALAGFMWAIVKYSH